jgi:hypothetical protein
MATYADLALNRYYLIREYEDEDIELIHPVMETKTCILITYKNHFKGVFWKKKADIVFEIIEELDEEQLAEYENIFDKEDDWSYNPEEDDAWEMN